MLVHSFMNSNLYNFVSFKRILLVKERNTRDLRKTLAYLLLFLFLFNSLGYYFIFELYKYHVKKEIQAQATMDCLVLTILKIADASHDPAFQRVEKKEIRYRGYLYDVIKEVQVGRMTIFYCIHDKKEEILLATMNSVNKSKFLLSLWQHMITIAIPPFDISLTDTFPVNVLFPQISVPLQSVLMGTWSPPPEIA